MLIITLIKGIVIGVVIALPVGPVGLLCVRRTLFEGASFGLVSGLGAACADTMFGIIAGFGLTFVRDWILGYQDTLGAAGGFYLLWAGARALRPHAAMVPEPLDGEALAGTFMSSFALTIANPITIFSFTAIFAEVGIRPDATDADIAVLVGGVFVGSALWWLGIAVVMSWVRRRARAVSLGWLDRVSGTVMLIAGVALLAAAGLGFAGIRL
jgi:threonine/homoserine/homoserine lactone efflux protein